MVEKFVLVCEKRLLKVNVDKSKIVVFEHDGDTNCVISINGEYLEVVDEFKYLGSMLSKNGLCKSEIDNRVLKGRSVSGAIKKLLNQRHLSIQCARALHEGILVPTLLYGNETVTMYDRDVSRLQAVEMNMLRNDVGVKRWDRQ